MHAGSWVFWAHPRPPAPGRAAGRGRPEDGAEIAPREKGRGVPGHTQDHEVHLFFVGIVMSISSLLIF